MPILTELTQLPTIHFEKPLFQAESLAADWQRMRTQITSTTELEAAARLILPHSPHLQDELTDVETNEILACYNTVVTDGRYIAEFATDPGAVADRLQIPLAPRLRDAIARAGSRALHATNGPQPQCIFAIIAIVLVFVVAVPKEEHGGKRPLVIDLSGAIKL